MILFSADEKGGTLDLIGEIRLHRFGEHAESVAG